MERPPFSKALRIYKYLSILFSLIYWIYIVIDDYIFIEKYWSEHWSDYLLIWIVYFLVYFFVFSIYYWLLALIVVFIHRSIRRKREKS